MPKKGGTRDRYRTLVGTGVQAVGLTICLLLACRPSTSPNGARAADDQRFGTAVGKVLILGPTLIDVVAGVRRPVQAIYVEDGLIAAIGRPPIGPHQADLVIDAAGRFVMPGMVDMHVHHSADGAFPTTDGSLYDDADLLLYLAHGVTTVRNMAGRQSDPALAEKIAREKAARPRYFTSGPPVVTAVRDDAVTSTEAARALVRSQHEAGFDLIKLYCCFGPEREEVLVALLAEAERFGLPVAGHVPKDLPLHRAHRLRSIEHLEHLADMLDETTLPALADSGVFVTPTLVPFASHRLVDPDALANFLKSREAAFISEVLWETELKAIGAGESVLQNREIQVDIREMFESGRAAVRRLADAGVPLLVGTDAGGLFPVVPGFSYPEELTLLVGAGLTTAQALQAATWNAARALGVAHRRGNIAVGMDADLIVLGADPLLDIGNVRSVEGVMVGKWWLERAALDAAVASRVRR